MDGQWVVAEKDSSLKKVETNNEENLYVLQAVRPGIPLWSSVTCLLDDWSDKNKKKCHLNCVQMNGHRYERGLGGGSDGRSSKWTIGSESRQ